MIPWPHQLRAVSDVLHATTMQIRRIIVTSPTGGGKSLMMRLLAQEFLTNGGNAILYSNRRMMVDQLSEALEVAGVKHGVRAAGYDDQREFPFQVSSIQTENSRVNKKGTWDLHKAHLVLLDEAHIQTGNAARKILQAHYDAGAAIVMFTATPLGMEGMADHLIVAGTMSELRACGALVLASHYGADEPDMKEFRKSQEGQDPSAAEQKKAIMTPTIFGRVWEWYQKLNPERKPCLLFGPGVNESLWFAEKFVSNGVPAAHIDGYDVWINGTWYKSDKAARDEVREQHKAGVLKVVCNRYVLREGVDWPWIEHIILGFVAGSLQTYLQTVGRGLRACPSTGKKQLIVQDHGGAWWRHGSINDDRDWRLGLTDSIVFGMRAERLRKNPGGEPFRCPKCGRVWKMGTVCREDFGGCGFELGARRKSRPVVSTDGELKELTGRVFKPRQIMQSPTGPEIWKKMYFRSCSKKGTRTFRAAAALFAYENNWQWPDTMWPFMPIEEFDFYVPVSSVPRERLR